MDDQRQRHRVEEMERAEERKEEKKDQKENGRGRERGRGGRGGGRGRGGRGAGRGRGVVRGRDDESDDNEQEAKKERKSEKVLYAHCISLQHSYPDIIRHIRTCIRVYNLCFGLVQVRWFDGWSCHCLVELVWRYLPIWGHCRWIRCYHFKQKHQAVKAFWRNTNSTDKALQVLCNLARKQALLHVLSGGYWFFRACFDGVVGVKLVKLGEAAAAHLLSSKSLARQIFNNMTSQELPDATEHPFDKLDSEFMVCVWLYLCQIHYWQSCRASNYSLM